jgi:hypothetical protein
MFYKVRASQFKTLLADCGKVRNKLEWENLELMNASHIKLAIEIYNSNQGMDAFVPAEVKTLDMDAGNENEPYAIEMFDEFFKTNYYESYKNSRNLGLDFERFNDYLTGTRDFGDTETTFDCKCSTDKNVFNNKIFKPTEVDYIVQLNAYGYLYGTPKLKLYNALTNATMGQIKKFVSNKQYIDCLSELQANEYCEHIEKMYCYENLDLEKRIDVREVETIEGFPEIVKKRVTVMNNWIEANKHRL